MSVKTAVLKYIKSTRYDSHMFVSSGCTNAESYDMFGKIADKLREEYKDSFVCAKRVLDMKGDDDAVLIFGTLSSKKKITLTPRGIYKVQFTITRVNALCGGSSKVTIKFTDAVLVKADTSKEEDFDWA